MEIGVESTVVNKGWADHGTPFTSVSDLKSSNIDTSGNFHYVQLKVTDMATNQEKYVLRGYNDCDSHSKVIERFITDEFD